MTFMTSVFGLVFVLLTLPQSKAQPSSNELIAALRSTDARTKAGAARAISDRVDLHKDPAVKAAVLAELQHGVDIMKRRHASQSNVGSTTDFEYANVYLGLIQAAQRFEGEDVMLALIQTVGNSASARGRVASFGSAAIDPLMAAYHSPSGTVALASERLALLDTLSTIALEHQLKTGDKAKLHSLAKNALRSTEPPEVGGGMLLGAALRDPDLVAEIRELRASNFRGVNSTRSPNYLEAIAKKAFDRAGIR